MDRLRRQKATMSAHRRGTGLRAIFPASCLLASHCLVPLLAPSTNKTSCLNQNYHSQLKEQDQANGSCKFVQSETTPFTRNSLTPPTRENSHPSKQPSNQASNQASNQSNQATRQTNEHASNQASRKESERASKQQSTSWQEQTSKRTTPIQTAAWQPAVRDKRACRESVKTGPEERESWEGSLWSSGGKESSRPRRKS